MPTYNVHFTQSLSAVVTVDADDPEAAIELAYESDRMPGSMCYGAFGDAAVDESGEWTAILVTDDKYRGVWSYAPVESDE